MPERLEAQEALAQVDGAREATVRVRRAPAWVMVTCSVLLGAAYGLITGGRLWEIVVAVVLVAVSILVSVRCTPKRARLTDDRAVRQGGLVYLLTLGLLMPVLGLFREATAWWVRLLVAAAVAVATFTYSYLVERYQVRRLSSGDYGPYDL